MSFSRFLPAASPPRWRWIVAMLVVSLGGIASAAAQPGYERAVRGVWVTNVDSDVLDSKANIAAAMDYLADNGFNVVFPVVWNGGYTLYPSPTMDALFGRPQDPFFASQGRDPLAELTVEAHRRGLEVVPWFEYGFAAVFTGTGSPPTGDTHIFETFPDWAARDNAGQIVKKNGFEWMNPLHPEVQTFLLDLVDEVLTRYDVDGVQGDDRLPAMPVEAGYSDTSRALYRSEHDGDDPPNNDRNPDFVQWRADEITAFAGRLSRLVKQHGDRLTVSLSPSIYPFSLNEYLQDWPTWMDSSYADLVHPQAYRFSLPDYQQLLRQMLGTTPAANDGYLDARHRDRVAPGILLKSGTRLNGPDYARGAAAFNRTYGLPGEVYFFYEGLGPRNQYVADTLGRYVYQTPAVLPHRTTWWRPPAQIRNENDPGAAREGPWQIEVDVDGFSGNTLTVPAGASGTITYPLAVPAPATYDVFAYVPDHDGAAALLTYAVGTETATVSTDVNPDTARGWVRLASVPVAEQATVTLTVSEATQPAYADAVMAMINRQASPDAEIAIPVRREPVGPETPGADDLHLTSYPNPARATVTLQLTLPAPAPVELALYDVLGRRVRAVLTGHRRPAGSHAVRLATDGLAPGVYVARLQVGSRTATHALTLLP